MTPRKMKYQDFELTADPRHLKSGKWTTRVFIRLNKAVREFTADDTFDREEDAVIRSLDFGRKIIDGEVPEFDGFWIT